MIYSKSFSRKAQTAIEYLLLLTICALIAFVVFRLFFNEGGRARDVANQYFLKVQEEIVGEPPSF